MSITEQSNLNKQYDARKKYLRAKEVAEYMGIGLSTVWLYASNGTLTPKKISARVTVFSIDEINNLINSVEVV
ncbi:DNA-binding protein [Sulfurimonas sp. SAG-AH-194-L11]|nr:DNA-binding protein [Sulfurimonas sp. SAG-AH-194-L11]MDF1877295.1 DNA-binding protein [Sulfurimonas sp. SAG-AH-194-L11]